MSQVLTDLLYVAACLVGLLAVNALLVRLLRVFVVFVSEALDLAAALFFFVVIVPPLWVWKAWRRPMWRTLTKQQSEALQAWLKTTASR